MDFSFTSMS